MKNQSIAFENYDDPICLLQDFIEMRKGTGQNFSYRWFAQKAGFKSPNYLHLIINRKRKINLKTAEKISKVFSWKQWEKKYFLKLTEFHFEEDYLRKQELAQSLLGLRQLKLGNHFADGAQIEDLYLHSLGPILFELSKTGLPNHQDFLEKLFIADFPFVHIKKVIKHLVEKKLLVLKDNILFASENINSTGDEVYSQLVKKYHSDMMRLAVHSMYEVDRKDRDISGLSLTLNESQFQKIKTKLQAFRKELLAIELEMEVQPMRESEKLASNPVKKKPQQLKRLYQLGIQLFPLTKVNENE
ncbi:MAG: TIGR02147 family protein [Bdellovibrionota bacterium]|nr:TIGR02147 family protein [Bdellovibrionota bacterium]